MAGDRGPPLSYSAKRQLPTRLECGGGTLVVVHPGHHACPAGAGRKPSIPARLAGRSPGFLPWGERPASYPNAAAVRRPLGVPDDRVSEEDEAVPDGPSVEGANGLLVADLVEEAIASPEH